MVKAHPAQGSAAGSQTPVTADVDYDGFDLTDLSLLQFRLSTDVAPAGTVRTIYYDDAQGMIANALTGDFFQWEINAANEMKLDLVSLDIGTKALILGIDAADPAGSLNYINVDAATNTIINAPTGDSIRLATAGVAFGIFSNFVTTFTNNHEIRFGNVATRRILNNTGGFIFEVESGDTFQFDIGAGVTEMSLSATILDLQTNNLQLGSGSDIILSTTTGTKIGTGTTQLLAFYNATPVVQPTALTAEDATAINSTYDAVEEAVLNNVRTRLGEVETKLQALGLLA